MVRALASVIAPTTPAAQGHIYPSMQIRRKLAKALGVSPQELWNTRPEDITDRGEESTKQAS